MKECCGKPRPTRFCPDCGAELRKVGPVGDLLAHVRKTARNFRAAEKRWQKDSTDNDTLGRVRGRLMGRNRASAERWEAWADALEALINGEAEESA